MTIAEPNRKKTDFLFLPSSSSANERRQNSANEKSLYFGLPVSSNGLFVYNSPPNFLFPSIKEFLLPLLLETCRWLAMVADPILEFFADPE